MPELIVVVPSRGRPQNVARLLKACAETCTADTRVDVVVDGDDPMLDEYKALEWPSFALLIVQSGNTGHGPVLNAAAVIAAWAASVVGKLDDDHVPRTAGWDKAMLDVLQRPGVAYGDDLHQGQALPTAPFITSNLIRCLGFYCPPTLIHLYVDNFWALLGQNTQLTYLPQVVIEHMHPNAGKAERDAGYDDAESSAMWAHDRTAWDEYVDKAWSNDRRNLVAAGLT